MQGIYPEPEENTQTDTNLASNPESEELRRQTQTPCVK